jgi:hypothetical protein
MVKELPRTAFSASQVATRERKAMRFWTCVICGFFSIDFTIAAIAISMAAGDPSFRSIPGYGERAVAWDVRQERKLSSRKLGWKVEVNRVEPSRDAIEVVVRDAADDPVTGCKGSIQMFHFTRVADQLRGELIEIEPGVYRTSINVSKAGRWQMDLVIHAEGKRDFWDEQTLNWFAVSELGSATRQ